jgi:hypothetical protein
MKKRLIDGLLGLIIGIILILFLTPKNVDVTDLLKEKDKEYGKQIGDLQKTIKDLETKDKLLLNTITLLRADKSQIVREKEIYRIKYERLKNTPVPISHLSDKQVDSLLAVLYPR